MWIRSQNQENYLDASGKTFSIYNGNQIRMKYANSSVLLGEYSSSKKAHNVLNKLRKQNDKWHSMNVFYSGNNMGLTICIFHTNLISIIYRKCLSRCI